MEDEASISRRDLLRGRLNRPAPPPAPPADSAARTTTPAIAHRPPGAVHEQAFLAGCTRCGDCIEACPVDAIRVADARYGPAADTPVIEPMVAACVMCEERACIVACEPGVLSFDAPLVMGTASIRSVNCLAWQGTSCTVCSERCPVEGAIEVKDGRPAIVEERCTGCGTCQHVCPAPYNAVLVLPRAAAAAARTPAEPAADGEAFDWRAAYLGGRSLRPPDGSG